MTQVSTKHLISALGVVALFAVAAPLQAFADDDGPSKPRIDCTKPENKKKAACKPHHSALDDEIINGAYWLAHAGKHAEALALLATVQDKDDPRALNAMGFATRKLGNVDAALPYYARALAIDPNYVQARAYLGEAFLAKGDVIHAREQLGEIARRVGADSVSFANLKREIGAFKATRAARG
ncbi:tetratricopeptide repeat protein [Hyphomicrobium sp.]|uniref:tetratricopeptide repeat protein n=1 Tax=Hyphomicrobium sp. TaxID=82 RepID=UPI0025BAE85D|nr:tetratricopeptide repeat protein [Hyphomicrobium sp.]MCC7253324.1 tetratricopeptide repeat protein [Hyphomicrobium sp.]